MAVAAIGRPTGDPASLAVSRSSWLDRALLPPEGAVPVAERLSAEGPCLVSGGSPVRIREGGEPAGGPFEAWLGPGALPLAALTPLSRRVPASPSSRPVRAG